MKVVGGTWEIKGKKLSFRLPVGDILLRADIPDLPPHVGEKLGVKRDESEVCDVLRRIVTAWREDEIGQIDGALIEEAEKLLDIEAKPDPLAAESAEPAR